MIKDSNLLLLNRATTLAADRRSNHGSKSPAIWAVSCETYRCHGSAGRNMYTLRKIRPCTHYRETYRAYRMCLTVHAPKHCVFPLFPLKSRREMRDTLSRVSRIATKRSHTTSSKNHTKSLFFYNFLLDLPSIT